LTLELNGDEPDQGEPLHLMLDKNSKVEIVKANAFVDWGLSGDLMQVAFGAVTKMSLRLRAGRAEIESARTIRVGGGLENRRLSICPSKARKLHRGAQLL